MVQYFFNFTTLDLLFAYFIFFLLKKNTSKFLQSVFITKLKNNKRTKQINYTFLFCIVTIFKHKKIAFF